MNSEQLLNPRFEVIAEYPSSIYIVNQRLDALTKSMIAFFSKYPHLFRKLNWWEHRKAEDMPKKVMSLADEKKDIYEIEEWDMELLLGWIDKKNRSCCSLETFEPQYGYIPVD